MYRDQNNKYTFFLFIASLGKWTIPLTYTVDQN